MIEGIRYQIAEDAKGMTQAEAKAYVTDLFNKVGENIVEGVYPSVDDVYGIHTLLTRTLTPAEIRLRAHAFKSFEKVTGVALTTQNNDAVLRYWRNLPNEVFMGNPTEEAALSIARGALTKKEAEIFQSPHWWGEAGKGNIAHIRAGTWTNPADKKKYLFVIEVQSDWANRALGEGGFQTGEVIPEELLGDAPVPKDRFKLVPEQEGLTEPMREGQVKRRMESGVLYEYTSPDGVVEEFTISSSTHRQYLEKEYVDGILNIDTSWDLFKHKKVLESKRTPRAPFVSTPAGKVSDAWMGVALKRILAEAASEGLDGVVITTKDFANTTRGIQLGEDYVGYSKMATMLRKIGKKVDPDATFIADVGDTVMLDEESGLYIDRTTAEVVEVESEWGETILPPSGAALQITDKMRDAVAQGMPMFGNTTMEARRDLGIRMNETSSKLRIGGGWDAVLKTPSVLLQLKTGEAVVRVEQDKTKEYWALIDIATDNILATFNTEKQATDAAAEHYEKVRKIWLADVSKQNSMHTVLADVIDTLPIQEYVEAGKLTWLRGYWDEELDPLVRDYVHSLERAYNEWYIKDQQKKAEQPPVEGMVPTFAMEEEATWEVPDNPWREVAELFEDGPNRDATPIMTLLKLGRKIRFMYENLSDTMTISAQEVLADRAGFTLASLARIVFRPSFLESVGEADPMLPEVDMEYLEEAARRAEGQEDRRLVLKPSRTFLGFNVPDTGVALPMRVDKDVNPYAPMEAFQKASRTMFDSPDVDITKTGDQLWEDTLGFSYEDRPKSMKVDSVLVEGWDIPNVEANAAWLVRYRKGGKHVGTILHLTPAGGFRNAQTVEAKTYKKLSENVLDIVRDISFPLTQEEAAGLTYGEIFNQDTQMHARRLDGSKRMVSITGVQPSKLMDLVEMGRIPMPSIATVDTERRLPFFRNWSFGDVFLVWDPDAVRPETGEPTYAGDAYSVRTPQLIQRGGETVFEDEGDYVSALAYNILEYKHRKQAERGGVRGSEVSPKASGIAAGLVRSTVLDKVTTTEQMREELSKRQPKEHDTGELSDTFARHRGMWREAVRLFGYYPDRESARRGRLQLELYSAVRDFFSSNPKPEGVSYDEYLSQPKTEEAFIESVGVSLDLERISASLAKRRGVKEGGFKSTDILYNLLNLLKDMSASQVAYFETKPQRTLPFGKGGVVGVLIPASTSHDMSLIGLEQESSVLENLQEMGVNVRRYQNESVNVGNVSLGMQGHLNFVQDSFVSALDSLEDDVMYARKLPADRTSILNSPAMGMIMRDEFERRGLTPAEQTPFQAGFRAGGRATKKLQAVRDKEERKYAIETERERARAREAQKLRNQRELLERRIERVKRKAADAEILRESAITIVKLLSKKDRGDLAVRLARVTTPKRLSELAERAVELAATSEYKESVRRLRKLKTRFNKRKLGMTNNVKAEVLGLIATAEAQAYQSGTKKMLPAKGEKLSPSDAVSRASEIHDKLDKAVELVKEATLEYRASREDRKGRLGTLAVGLIDALRAHKELPQDRRGKHYNRKSKAWFRRSRTTLSMIELVTQHAPVEVQQALAELLHYDLADAESDHLSEVRDVLKALDTLAKNAGYKSLDAMMDVVGTTDIEAVTETVRVQLGDELTTITLDGLMKIAAMDEETVSMIVDEVDDTGAVVKSGTGIQFEAGDMVEPILGITRAQWEQAVAQLPKELQDFVRAAKAIREALRAPAFKAYYQIHGTEPKAVDGYEPRKRERTPQQAAERLDVEAMTAGFIDDAGFTKGRTGGGQAVKIGGFVADFLTSTEALSKLAHMAVPLRDAVAVLGQREVQDAINTHMGAEFGKDLENRLMHAAGMIQRLPRGFLMKISSNLARAFLTLSPRTWGRVLFGGVSNLAIQMNPSDLAVGVASLVNVKTNLQEAWTNGYLFARSRSGAMRRQTQEAEQTVGRIADQDALMSSVVKMSKSLARAAQYLIQGDIRGSWRPISDVAKEVYRLPDSIHVLQAMDNLIVAVAYGAYKSKYQAEGLTGDALVRAASTAAERITRETQNTSSALDATVLDAQDAVKGSQKRAFFPFASDPVTKANALYRAIRFGNANQRAVATVGFVSTIATNIGVTYGYAMLLKLLAGMFEGDEPDYHKEQMRAVVERAHDKKAVEQSISGAIDDLLGMFGYAGIIASWGLSALEGYDAGNPALWASVTEDVARDAKNLSVEVAKDETDEEKVWDYIARLLETGRMGLGDPTVMPQREFRKGEALADPTVEDVEKAVRGLKRQSPLARLLGMEAEELSREEERALTRLRAKDKRDKAREERLANQPQP